MEINWIGEALDTVFSLLGKGGRWFNNQGKRICFVIWSVCAVYWIGRDLYLHLYSQSFFLLISLALHIHGYWNWGKKGIGK